MLQPKNGKESVALNMSFCSKELICREFGQLLPSKHTLYRVDYLEDPVFAIRRES